MQFQKANFDRYKNAKRNNRKINPENLQDQEYGEMVYTEPNANQISSPMMDSQEQIFDQNEQMEDDQKANVYPTFGLKNNPNLNKGQYIQEQRLPPNNEEEINRRSPKFVINAGTSGDDYEYRMPTLSRANQNYPNNMNENYDGNQYEDDEYQEYQNDSQIPKTTLYSRNRSPQGAQRNRNNSPPGYGGVIPLNQISPPQTFDEFNTSTDKNAENINRYAQQNYLGNNNQTYASNQTYQQGRQYEPNQTLKNPSVLNILRDEVSNKYNNQTYNNMSYRDVKKIANRFSKVYDPNRNNNGILIEESQITVPGAQDEVFNNRYKVLSKMNRLSNILLAKKNKRNPQKTEENTYETKTFNRQNSYNNKKPFDRHTLARSPQNTTNRKAFSRSPNNKFLYVSLAMISSKGPSTEDRPILRWMRLEKGGVVDLAQEDRKKNKFQIKKAAPKKGLNKGFYTNPKYRDSAAKVIQNWWRELKNIYNDRLAKIIKIQSAFRGKFVRKYMYDLFYLNFLYISFCKKIENVLAKHVRPYVWDKLFSEQEEEETPKTSEKEKKLERLLSRDYRKDLNLIEPAWRKWLSNTRRLNMQNAKGRNLVQIRSDKENKLGEIKNAFNKWKYLSKVLEAEDKLLENENENNENLLKNREKDRENNLKKIKGLFNIIDGVDKYFKKEAMNETLPKLENYLKKENEKNKLRKLVKRKPIHDRNLLRKYFYKWLGQTFKEEEPDNKELDEKYKKEVEDLKNKIFKNIIIKIKIKQQKNIIRKYLYKWLKKTIIIAIKEEKDKAKQREKDYKDKEYEIIEKYEKKIVTYETQKKEDDDAAKKIKNALDKLKNESQKKLDDMMKEIEENKDNNNKNLLDYLKGAEILQRAVRRITHPDPLHAFGEKIDKDNIDDKLLKLVKIRKLSDNDLLRKYFNRWKRNALKKVDSEILYKLLAKLIEMTSNNHKNKILRKKFNQWRRAAGVNPYDSLEKARGIYDLGDLIRKIYVNHYGKEFLDELGKIKNPEKCKNSLSKLVKKKDDDNKDELRKAFDKWRKFVQDENMKKLKHKLIYKIYEKYHPDMSKDLLNKYFQIWKNKTFKDNLRKYKNDLDKINSKQQDTTRLFVKSIVNGLDKKTNNDLLREYFNRWKKIVDLEKNENYQKNKKKIILAKIVEKKTGNDQLNLLQYLLRWKNKIYELRAAEAHKPYRKKIIRILLTKNDKEELQRCFTKWKYSGYKRLPIMPYIVAKRFLKKVLCRRAYNEFVKKMTERDPKVLKKKGKELIKALQDIKNNRIRDFLDKLLKFIQRKYLGKIQPKVNDKIKEYYLKKYFDRWVENTLGLMKKRKELITNWLKNKLAENKLKNEKRKNELLDKFFNNLDKNRKLELAHGLLKFRKNAKLDEQIENAKIIQDYCRRLLNDIIKDKLEKRKQLADLLCELFRKKFFKDLNDLAKDASPILEENYKKNKYKFDKLRKVVTTNDNNKNLDLLRKYWNIWKNNPGLYEKYTIIIQKEIRKYFSKNKLDKLKRLNDILYKLLMTNKDKEKDLLGSRFYQWLKKTKDLQCQENAKIIQDFCRNRLDNYLRNKLAKYLEQLAKKYTTYLINNNAKVDKLNKALRHNPLKEALDAIKRRALLNKIKEALINVLTKQDDLNRKTILKHYLDKWNKKANKLKNRENDMASKIQAAYRGHNFRKLFNLDERRAKLLKRLIEKLILVSNPKNILASALAKWRKNNAKLACDENARIIQNFCRKLHNKILDDKAEKNLENYKNLANVLNKIKVSPREFFDKLKEIRRNKILEDLLNKLAEKRLKNLKDAFDEIKNFPKFKYLLISMIIQDDLKNRLLKKCLNKWRNKAMRYRAIMELLRSIFSNYDDFKNNLLRHNLYRWQYKAKYLTQDENAKIIQDFCRDTLKKINAIRNWHKLADGLKNKGKDKEVEDILDKLRNLVGLNKLKKPINDHVKKDVLDKLKKNKQVNNFIDKIRPYFNKNDEFWKNNLLREYFDKWRNNADKLKKRNEGLDDMMKLLDKLRKKKAVEGLNDALIVKKFLHDYPLIRALGFFKKLKELSKDSNLAKDLINAKENLEPKKRTNLIKKLYKVYAYKVLNKLFEDLENIQRRKSEPLKKEFMDLLHDNLLKKAERTYTDNKQNETIPKNLKTSFRLKKPTKISDDKKKKLIYVSLLPALFNYLNQKILDQKEDAFNEIKKKSDADKFCELYKKWAEKQELEPKKELVDKLKRIYYREKSEGPLLLKLFKILRHESIRRILKKSKKTRKVMGMMYVTRLLIMQREIAKAKFLRQLIRRWRYVAFSKKLAMNKMKTIYKNLHMTYLEMANCLFGDENKNDPSVIKEFERFGTSVGMWENEKPNEKEEEKYVKAIKTQYVFDPIDFEKFQSKYYPTEYEEEYYEEDEKEVEKKTEKIYYKDDKDNKEDKE